MFKQINGYEGYYKINESGDVFSQERTCVRARNAVQFIKEKKLTPQINHKGYEFVILCINKNRKHKAIHRLVAEAFIPNPENKPQVNHKNSIKTDNRVENLEWVDNLENMRHAFNSGVFTNRDNGNKRPIIISNDLLKMTFDSIAEASDYLGTSSGAIGNVLNGSRNSIKGYKAEYLKS